MGKLLLNAAQFLFQLTFCLSLGYILDDEEIVDTLSKSKITSNEISKRIKATVKAESELQATRKSYLPIATRGTLLYFLVASLTQVNYMYQFSLDWFRKVFVSSVFSKRKEQEGGLESDTMPLEKVDEIPNVSSQSNLESGENLVDNHVKNSIEVLTRNVFKVSVFESSMRTLYTYPR
jgi:dynein heavy chain